MTWDYCFKHKKLVFRKEADDTLINYVDASHNCHADGRGHSAIVIKIGYNTIGIRCNKQKDMTESICEAEIVALH